MSVLVIGNGPIKDSWRAKSTYNKFVRFNTCQNIGTTGYKTSILCLTNYVRPILDLDPIEIWLWHRVKISKDCYPEVKRIDEYESIKKEVIENLKEFGGKNKMPSSGILALTKLLKTEEDISLIGFTWQGWNGHDFLAEEKYCRNLEAKNRIKIL